VKRALNTYYWFAWKLIRKIKFLMKEENCCIRIKKVSYRKILRRTNKSQKINLGSFIGKVK